MAPSGLSLSPPGLQLAQLGCPKGFCAAVLEPEISSLLLVHVGICANHRNSAELSKLLHLRELRRSFGLMLKDLCCHMKKACTSKGLPKSSEAQEVCISGKQPLRVPCEPGTWPIRDTITNALATHGKLMVLVADTALPSAASTEMWLVPLLL